MRKTARILATVFALLFAFSHPAAAGPSRYDLPGDCAIVAAEAASRLAATGAWVRVVYITFFNRTGQFVGHAVTVWQMPTAKHVFVYDEYILEGGGSLELDTNSHDCDEITAQFARKTHILILEAHFVT